MRALDHIVLYITEKIAHQHAQNTPFWAIRLSQLVLVDRLVAYPIMFFFIHLRFRLEKWMYMGTDTLLVYL